MMPPEADCVECECPMSDHVPLKYVWRVWWRHKLLRIISPALSRIRDTSDGI